MTKPAAAPKKTGSSCASTASDGTLKCALAAIDALGRSHTVHTTLRRGAKAPSHTTWSLADDGRVAVVEYVKGKCTAERFEGEAVALAPKSNLCGVRWERGADGSKIPKAEQVACGRDPGHDGPHRGFRGAHRSEWEGSGSSGGVHMPVTKDVTEPDGQTAEETPPPAKDVTAARPLTKIGDHEVHPAAALFPMIGEAKWPAFVEDIRENGQREPIVRIQVPSRHVSGSSWLILDGRNRLRACIEANREPKFRVFGDDPSDGSDPIRFVTSVNVQRRHLDETELSYIGMELIPMYEAQARQRQREGGRTKGSATLREASKASEAAAAAVGVSPRSIESALKVKRDASPELLEASRGRGQVAVSAAAELAKLPMDKQREQLTKADGRKITLGKARSIVNQERKREVVRSINEQQVTPMPEGPFRVIVCDWPWLYDNSDQHEGSRGHIPYPGMSTDQAFAMTAEIEKLAHEDGCVLGFWTTNAFMPDAVRIVEAWGFTWRTIRTWDKGRDGIGTWCRSRTEHLIIAERGDVEHTLNEVSTLIVEPRREHSRKPDEAMAVFEKHCPGPLLEMFQREPRANWAGWGAEKEKFFSTEAA